MEPSSADALSNDSFLGRLLEEVSWEKAVGYRQGGRRRENVLTAEVLLPLSYLPRDAFLGEVLRRAHGAERAREAAAREAELAGITLLPEEHTLPGGIRVQPDAEFSMPASYVLVEAKRIGRASFQRTQLAKEYLAVRQAAGSRIPLLVLILGTPPPIAVKETGAMTPEEAVMRFLPELTGGAVQDAGPLAADVREAIAWTTWTEIAATVESQCEAFAGQDRGLEGTIRRLCSSVGQAVRWHS
jgi:hypothetical protein